MPERRRTTAEERGGRTRTATTAVDPITAWVRSVDADAQISLGPPGEAHEGKGASVHLLDLAPQPAARGAARPPLQLWLRYLVSTWATDRAAADQLLVDLAYAAMGQADIELETTPPSPATWTALQVTARPAFVIRVTARRARTRPAAPPVLHPLRLQAAQPGVIAGVVRGPGRIPIPDATVALPSLDREARTDAHGRFLMIGVPGPPVSTQLVVRARGTEVIVKLPKDPARARDLVIDITSLEGVNA